ncbi:hypothetical protein BV22DRAFT_43647 [Leucogyrophana mollusca]|uniref:Uncharacterized protein n=1 Tax=Leucogyrophana mollusca TaxID=85980 RepID=A0ACB8C1C1_9AGAM|nr:hypothetical protein BV22DRAFT_43647 [Leucogyrophana mollusca]
MRARTCGASGLCGLAQNSRALEYQASLGIARSACLVGAPENRRLASCILTQKPRIPSSCMSLRVMCRIRRGECHRSARCVLMEYDTGLEATRQCGNIGAFAFKLTASVAGGKWHGCYGLQVLGPVCIKMQDTQSQ